jgi:excinuclease ABC subunit A
MQVHIAEGASDAEAEHFYRGLCSPTHHFVYADVAPDYFMFNNPESACRTCGGLGVHKLTHPELLVPDPRRSILGGCFVREAFNYNPEWIGGISCLIRGEASGSDRRRPPCVPLLSF